MEPPEYLALAVFGVGAEELTLLASLSACVKLCFFTYFKYISCLGLKAYYIDRGHTSYV